MKRICIAAAVAVLAFAATVTSAHADQTLKFDIVGKGRVVADGVIINGFPDGVDCSRNAVAGPPAGDCSAKVVDLPDECNEQFCFPTPGRLTFEAKNLDGSGFQFTSWSHSQCPDARNPCTVLVALGAFDPPNPDLLVTANYTDVQDPTAALTAPRDGAVVSGTIPIVATASDNAGVTGLVLRVRGNPVQTFEVPPFTTQFNTLTLPDGPAPITATAKDGVNRTAMATANVTIDNTDPTLTVTGPDGQTFGPGATPAWTIAADDVANGQPTVQCSVVAVGQPPAFGACTSATRESLPNHPDGRFTLTVRALDRAGHSVTRTRAFAVDTGPPETTITSGPADGAGTTDTAITWGLSANEPGATFACRFFVTATAPGAFAPCSAAASHAVSGLAPGSYTFEVRATDVFGNADPTPARRTVTVVAPPPVTPPPVVHETTIVEQVVVVTLTFSYRDAGKRTTRISALVVNSVPAGSTVTARCLKGCARKTFVKKNAKGNVSLKTLAGKKPLKAKTKITVTVSKPGAVSAVKVLVVQKSKAPTVTSFCQPPGAKKPGPCA